MIRRIAFGSLAALAVSVVAAAVVQQDGGRKPAAPQDPWAAEKANPKFADVDWTYNQDTPINDFMQPQGATLYQKYCVSCHGESGQGDGELAPFLIPAPRNFTKGIFKGRSSHPELPPCATDLMRSMIHGLPLSGMVSYSFLQTPDQQALIAHVKSLAGDHFKKGFGYPLKSGNFHRALRMPLPTAETIARGRALFDRLSCILCHGPGGDGKGPVAPTLSDTGDGRPSHVRDFTQGIFSGGPNVRHMYLRITGGVQGTVMPPFATSASPEDRWALAQFVASLNRRDDTLPLPHHDKLLVTKAAALPKGPGDPAWAAVEALGKPEPEIAPEGYPVQPYYVLPLYFQQPRLDPTRPYYSPADVRALHDGASIAFLVTWADPKGGDGDRFEIQLSANATYGFILYGSAEDPANVWRWESAKPDAATELDGQGPFDLKPQAASDVKASGIYDAARKRWSVMFTRALAGTAGRDAAIAAGAEIPVLFLMRDGNDSWPETRPAAPKDPDADPIDPEAEAVRAKAEAEIKSKFGDLPRHISTWHKFQLKE